MLDKISKVCNKCGDRTATYSTPEWLCTQCWVHWFTHKQPDEPASPDDISPEQEEEYYQEVLAEILAMEKAHEGQTAEEALDSIFAKVAVTEEAKTEEKTENLTTV